MLVGVLTVTPAKRDGTQIASRHTFSNGYFGMLHFSKLGLLGLRFRTACETASPRASGRVRASNVA